MPVMASRAGMWSEAVFALGEPTLRRLTELRTLLLGGDQLTKRPPRGVGFGVVNLYGPTECTVVATWGDVEPDDDGAAPHVGRPLPGTGVHLAEDGELLLSGNRLARGYVGGDNRAFREVAGVRCYATGDLVRPRPNGVLDFLGRGDDQVSVAGHRVESGDVRAALLSLPGVTDAAVFPMPGNRQLAAFFEATIRGGCPSVRCSGALSISSTVVLLSAYAPDHGQRCPQGAAG